MGSSIDLTHVGSKISGEDLRLQRDSVADLLHRRTTTFPGAQPVSFARKHIEELQEVDYYLCEKTDGIRCLLYLTQFIDEEGSAVETQFLIDRKNDYYYIHRDAMHIPPEGEDLGAFHTGTLLDGELVLQKTRAGSRAAYLIFDILAIDGENIMNRHFDRRIARAENLVFRPYRKFAKQYPQDVGAQPFDIQLKKMERPYGAEMMFKETLPKLPHGNDGLIFTCVGTPYTSGTDEHILKWKPPHENTIDYRLEIVGFPMVEDEDGLYEDWEAKPEIHLMVNHGQASYQYFATLNLTDAEWEATKGMDQILDGRIIECYRDPFTTHWRPKVEKDGTPRFRDDKTDANHISTVNSVLESIKDAVSEQDLIDAAGKIKAAYKARLAAKEAQVQEEQRRMVEAEKRRREAARGAQMQQQQQHAPVKREAEVKREVDVKREIDEDDGPRYED